jgi:hypothetical protein|tara:strand:+ start:388 stop:813 length:426 start_codon:yes stop_codon:yes gene_type:complete
MSKTKTVKAIKLKPFQKLLTVMISGKPTTVEEIDALLGKEIQMYRLSTYIWHIKTNADGVVKAIKDGRKVTAYQIVNVPDVKKYMDRVGITKSGFVAGTPAVAPKAAKVTKLKDLAATPVTTPVVETAPVAETLVVTEVTA